jgi:hypothetical protein
LQHTSTVPFNITRSFALRVLGICLVLDWVFVALFLISTLPEVRQLTVSNELNFLNVDVEANLPTNYAILKLYFGAIACALMVFWHSGKAPVFWKIATVVLFVMGLDESAQLHEVWGAGLAAKLFGTEVISGNQFTIIPYAFLLGSFYLSSLALFPKYSKLVFTCFFLSGIAMILSQAAEWSFDPAMDVMFSSFDALSFVLSRFGSGNLQLGWEEGLEMTGYSLLCGGVLIGISVFQERAGNGPA